MGENSLPLSANLMVSNPQACSTGGLNGFSIAAKSKLYIVKDSHSVASTDPSGARVIHNGINHPDGMADALNHITETVKNNNLQGKAVVLHAKSQY